MKKEEKKGSFNNKAVPFSGFDLFPLFFLFYTDMYWVGGLQS